VEKSDALPTIHQILHLMFGWWSQHTRHKLATCSPQARNIARNMYDMSGEEGEGRNMEKVFATWEKLFGTWKKCSQHDVWILVATCSSQARNMFVANSQHRPQHVHYVREGERGAQHGKNIRNMGKCVRNMGKGVRDMERVFATWERCSQHSQHASQHHDPTANMFPNLNRVAEKVSDPSARIGRPDASSSVYIF
jgi:hypothetical protein